MKNFQVNLTMSNGAASSSNVVDGNTVFAMIAECATGPSSIEFKVHTLMPTKIEVGCKYSMAHLFDRKAEQGVSSHSWVYTITPCVDDSRQDMDLTFFYNTLWALCLAYPAICSPEVATQLETEIESTRIVALTAPSR